MSKKHIHFPLTTAAQRQLLFETWEATGDVGAACRTAHVGVGTFYYWKPRFETLGYAGLQSFASRVPKQPHRTAPAIEQEVVAMRRAPPDWGKQRLADAMAQAHDWVPVVSPNTVKRILKDAQLWPETTSGAKKKTAAPTNRTAAEPGQTANIDLCFVPATHEVAVKLPAVSGSSGRLLVQHATPSAEESQWPGRVFEDPELPYVEAMHRFVQASQEPESGREPAEPQMTPTPTAEKQAVQQASAQLRGERRQVRAQRRLEDAAWQATRAGHQAEQAAVQTLSTEDRRQQRHTRRAAAAQWRALRAQRRATLAQRAQEDADWRAQRQHLRERQAHLPVVTAWIAVLVVLDNCNRQCWGLPLFVTGAHLTAEVIVAALRELLPPELQFLISDRGVHFKAQTFHDFLHSRACVHVLIARHRPQSNGIAERFVRTLKEWLADKAWQEEQELALLLQQFRVEYNDRPHQGLAIPGLSPNAFAERIAVI